MLSRILVFVAAAALAWPAPKKVIGSGRGENQDVILNVTVYADPESVSELVGDMGGHYVVAKVQVQPKYGKEVSIDHDDFLLLTFKNGERTRPMEPNQIAGSSALVLTGTNETVGEGSVPKRKWSIGGMGAGMGSGGTPPPRDPNSVKGKMEQSDKENPLKKVLEQKELPSGKLENPIEGLLYFPMEPQKLKDLELVFGAKETRIEIHFKPIQ